MHKSISQTLPQCANVKLLPSLQLLTRNVYSICHTATHIVQNSQGSFSASTSNSVAPSGPSALARRPITSPVTLAKPIETFLQLSQIVNKPVITRNGGANLGTVATLLVDISRLEVIYLTVEKKKNAVTAEIVGVIPLNAVKQVGDVVLVDDQDCLTGILGFDALYGCTPLLGMEVYRDNGLLGKVRDFSFSPQTGAVASLTYDEFGLPLLPTTLFDCFVIPVSAVQYINVGPTGLGIVVLLPGYQGNLASRGLITVIPELIKAVAGSAGAGQGGQRLLPAPSQPYMNPRALPAVSSQSAGYGLAVNNAAALGNEWEQYEQRLREWEAKTGFTREQYQAIYGNQVPSPRAPVSFTQRNTPATNTSRTLAPRPVVANSRKADPRNRLLQQQQPQQQQSLQFRQVQEARGPGQVPQRLSAAPQQDQEQRYPSSEQSSLNAQSYRAPAPAGQLYRPVGSAPTTGPSANSTTSPSYAPATPRSNQGPATSYNQYASAADTTQMTQMAGGRDESVSKKAEAVPAVPKSAPEGARVSEGSGAGWESYRGVASGSGWKEPV